METESIRQELQQLARRVEREPIWPVINAVHHDLATISGQLLGLIGAARREHGETPDTKAAEAAMARLRATSRQVGLDIRLASEAALALGIQAAIGAALEVLDSLERATSSRGPASPNGS